MKISIWAAAVICLAAAPAFGQPYRVSVATAATPGGFVNAETKGRQDSVNDLLKMLKEEKDYRGLFTVVDDPAQADLRLEVAWRGPIETDTSTGSVTLIGGTVQTRSDTIKQDNLQVKLHVGSHTEEFWALDPGKKDWLGNIPQLLWRRQADEVLKRIAKWTRENEGPIKAALTKS